MSPTDTTASPTTLQIRRTFRAARERVFDAWTRAETLQEFLCPENRACEATVDFRIGGGYRLEMLHPDGEIWALRGTYREIVPPERIVCTWSWEEDDPALEVETVLTLEFIDRGGDTELVLTHANFRDAEQRDGHARGWNGCFEKLEAALARPEDRHRVAADVEDAGTIRAAVVLPASAARVFDELASNAVTRWWVRPGVFDTRTWSADLRPGGRWEASGIGHGRPYTMAGEFVEVDAPRKLVQTWQGAGAPGEPTRLTYELEPRDGATLLKLTHEGFADPGVCDATCAGWKTSLEKLRELLDVERRAAG